MKREQIESSTQFWAWKWNFGYERYCVLLEAIFILCSIYVQWESILFGAFDQCEIEKRFLEIWMGSVDVEHFASHKTPLAF